MSSILKVDTIQDQAGNNIINENSNTITIGASGDTINIIGTLQNNGGALPGDISSVVAGTGLSGGGTSGAVTINIEAAQPTITSLGTITSFRSTGIDDNCSALRMTLTNDDTTMGGHLKLDYASANGNPKISFLQNNYSGATNIEVNRTGPHLLFNVNASERMRITSAGLVGIGTTSPDAQFQTDVASATIGGGRIYTNAVRTGVNSSAVFSVRADNASGSSNGDVVNIQGDGVGDLLTLNNNGTDRVTVQADGKVGIGTASPSPDAGSDTVLEIAGSTYPGLVINDTGQASKYGIHAVSADFVMNYGSGSFFRYKPGDNSMFFGNSERMRIPSGGGLLVGKTSSNIATAGFEISSGGDFSATKSGSTIAQFNRLTNDGDVVRIKKDGTTKHVFTTSSLGVGVASTVTTLTVGSTGSGGQGVTGKTALFSGTHTTVYNAGNNGTFGGITIVNGDSTSNRTAAGVNFVNGNSGVSSIVGTSDTASRGDLRFITRGADNSGNTSERMRIADNGSVLIGTSTSGSAVAGDLVVNGGVFLGGTAAANELDDYEEGTFTPTLNTSTGASLPLNSGIDVMSYTKIGRVVHIQGLIRLASLTNPSGAFFQIIGLPFTTASSSSITQYGGRGGGAIYYDDVGTGKSVLPFTFSEGQTRFNVYKDASTLAVNDDFQIALTYFTN